MNWSTHIRKDPKKMKQIIESIKYYNGTFPKEYNLPLTHLP
ncbi:MULTISPECIES: hypothetical protein [Sporolactobacillus]|uniref:Uncharacterized protein n=1 Tax=Sporolactobacillus inulinus TaxID=2078 RepID=A0A4Y1ZD04_9BACL|nr:MULTISPECIES: hypothetical protein [Sporolactobacillus]GAY76821.1 hypothetical protein NBRC111894_2375 [Sporolactobacillus inulinus]